MNKFLSLFVVVLMIGGLSSCKKRKAEKTLRGTWNIYQYEAEVYNDCDDFLEYDWETTSSVGEATFERKNYTVTYDITGDVFSNDCHEGVDEELSGKWNITEHEREFLLLHTYTIDLGGQEWNVYFDSETTGNASKAGGQDQVRLFRNTTGGGSIELYLERI